MTEAQRYTALRDVTVHLKGPGDTSKADEKNPRNDSQYGATLEAGDSVPENELADVDVQAYEAGKLGGLLDLVSESVAAEKLEEAQSGDYSPFTMRQKELSTG